MIANSHFTVGNKLGCLDGSFIIADQVNRLCPWDTLLYANIPDCEETNYLMTNLAPISLYHLFN
jgi:phage terminase large subunit-like protein